MNYNVEFVIENENEFQEEAKVVAEKLGSFLKARDKFTYTIKGDLFIEIARICVEEGLYPARIELNISNWGFDAAKNTFYLLVRINFHERFMEIASTSTIDAKGHIVHSDGFWESRHNAVPVSEG